MKRVGTRSMPINPISLTSNVKIHTPLYTHNNKKYIEIELPPVMRKRVTDLHNECTEYMNAPNVQIPLNGSILKVKIPTKGRNFLCTIKGVKTISELSQGDVVNVTIGFCGSWVVGDFCGVSWKLTSILTD